MASTSSNLFRSLTIQSVHNAPPTSVKAHAASKHAHIPTPFASPGGRRQLLLSLTAATTTLKAFELPSRAEDIGLFGLRKKLKKVEEEAEEIVKEGLETADKGIVAAEKGVEAAEEEIESALSFNGLAQAGAVAGAEVVGVLVASSIVNGILGPEGQKS